MSVKKLSRPKGLRPWKWRGRKKNVIVVNGKPLNLSALKSQMEEDFKDRNW
jgi:hypothetical protein